MFRNFLKIFYSEAPESGEQEYGQSRKWPWVTDPDPWATGMDDLEKLRFFWGRVYL